VMFIDAVLARRHSAGIWPAAREIGFHGVLPTRCDGSHVTQRGRGR
jgi:hypothetical protein